VVVGRAPSKFEYSTLNQAFCILLLEEHNPKKNECHSQGKLLARYGRSLEFGAWWVCYDSGDSELPSSCHGKAFSRIFESALSADILASETCMIGDDVVQDMRGVKAAETGTPILV
jgi:hypothetical protein